MRLFLLPLLAGCSIASNWVDDGLGVGDASIFEDHIASPYVLGQPLVFTAHLTAVSRSHAVGATVTVDDPSIFALGDPMPNLEERTVTVPAQAIGVGQTTLRVVDGNGIAIESIPLEVARADGVELVPRIAEVTDTPAPVGGDGVLDLLTGHTTELAVRYLDGDRPLAGVGLLTAVDGGTATVSVTSPESGVDHEWIEVTPGEVGDGTLSFTVGEEAPMTVPVRAVDLTEVASVVVTDLTPDGAGKGDGSSVSALALDADGGVVNGVDPTWTVDGRSLDGAGSLLYFTINPLHCHEVTATATASVQATTTLCGDGFDVTTEEQVWACATTPGGAGWAALGLGAAAVLRRRRPGHSVR